MELKLRNLVLLKGSKTFWKNKTFLKVFIIYHVELNCLEVIAENSASQESFNRIYVGYELLEQKLDQNTIIAKFEEVTNKKHSKIDPLDPVNSVFLQEIKHAMMVKYIYARLSFKSNPNPLESHIFLQEFNNDNFINSEHINAIETPKLVIEIAKPELLVPYQEGGKDCMVVK